MNVKRFSALVLSALVVLSVVSGCGQEMSASTTCKDFLAAPQGERDEAVIRIATELNAPNSTSPLGRPNIEYTCIQSPRATLGEVIEATG